MKTIKTFYCDDNQATCLICNTTYYKGKHIFKLPMCQCGNIPLFDITEYYVRFVINWPLIKVSNPENWHKEVLRQIAKNGKPSHMVDI